MSAAAYDMSAFDTAELVAPGPKIEIRSYRGSSLEELLPRIQAELGPDAVIVRRREGVVGGFAGFFGKKCIELHVQAEVRPPAAPAASVSFHDTGDEAGLPNEVLEAAMAQKHNFAQLLSAATEQAPAELEEEYDRDFDAAPEAEAEAELEEEEDEEELPPAAELDLDSEPEPDELIEIEAEVEQEEALAFLVEPLAQPAPAPTPLLPRMTRGESVSNARRWAAAELAKIRADAEAELARPAARPILTLVPDPEPAKSLEQELLAAGLSGAIATEVVDDVERDFLPFATSASPRAHARAALARRLPTSHGRRTDRRVIALVGEAGAGKTLTAAKLVRAYSKGAGLDVGLLSCEPFHRAVGLASLVDGLSVALEAAADPGQVRFALSRLAGHKIVVVDTPALDPDDPASVERVAKFLRAVRPSETHLVVRAGTSAAAARALLAAVNAGWLLVTHADTRRPLGELATVAIEDDKPFSYVSRGAQPAGIALADPAELAEGVLP